MNDIAIVEIGDSYKPLNNIRCVDCVMQLFVARSKHIYYFAFKPYLNNRVNHCHLVVELIGNDDSIYYQEDIDCSILEDGFYYCNVDIDLVPGNLYCIKFYSPDSTPNDCVSVYSGYRSLPYLDILFFNDERKISVVNIKYGFSTDGFIYDLTKYSIKTSDVKEIENTVKNKIVPLSTYNSRPNVDWIIKYTTQPTSYINNNDFETGLVSVVILMNSMITSTIDSILCQTQGEFELIVVDNCCDKKVFDDNFKFLSELVEAGGHIKIISFEESVNDSLAFNVASSYSVGEYILFLNSNVVLYKDYIEKCFDYIDEYDMVTTDFIYHYNKFGLSIVDLSSCFEKPFATYVSLFKRNGFKGFDIALKSYYDWKCMILMLMECKKIMFLDEVLFVSSSEYSCLIENKDEVDSINSLCQNENLE